MYGSVRYNHGGGLGGRAGDGYGGAHKGGEVHAHCEDFRARLTPGSNVLGELQDWRFLYGVARERGVLA
jgi:hypothetical protein